MEIWEKSVKTIWNALWNGSALLALWGACIMGVAADPNQEFQVEIRPADGSYAIHTAGLVVFESGVAAKIDGQWFHSKDYPKHTIVESQTTDELGAARQFVVTHTGRADAPDLVCAFHVRPKSSSVDFEVRVENHLNKTIHVEAIRPLEAFGNRILDLGGPDDADRVLSDSFSEDRPSLRIQDLDDNVPRGMHRGVGSQLVYNRRSGRSLFIGALSADRLLTILRLHVDPNNKDRKIQAFEVDSTGTTELMQENSLKDSPPEDLIELSLPLESGQSLSSERLLLSVSSDYHAQLESYGNLIRELHRARIPETNLMGWWSWTAYYFGLSENTALTNATWLHEHLEPLGYNLFHIDEGYQYARGEYTSPDATLFPGGMENLERKVQRLGLTPGIWTAPFEVSERSWVYAEHKDWLVHNAKGQPIHIGSVVKVERLYELDTTNPGAQAYLREAYKMLVNQWGIRYIKLDFMEDSDAEGYRYRPNTTALEAQRIGLSVIRGAVGNDVVLDKDGSPMLTPVGLVDAGRISVDTGHTFGATVEAAPAIAARYYMHRNFYLSDPDAYSVSRQNFNENAWHRGIKPLTLDEARAGIALSAVSGGMFEIGDDLPTLGADAERLALVENQELLNMVRLSRASRPVDLMDYLPEDDQPSVFLLQEDRRQAIVTVFNWTEKPREHSIDLRALGITGGPFEVLDVFAPGTSLPVTDGHITVSQGAHSARAFKIIDKTIPPAAPGLIPHVPTAAATGEGVRFSAQADPPGVPALSYHWTFGDGTAGEGRSVVHAYTTPGEYHAHLVADGVDGVPAEKTFSIVISGSIEIHFKPDRKKRLE